VFPQAKRGSDGSTTKLAGRCGSVREPVEVSARVARTVGRRIEEVTCVRDWEPLVRRADVVSQEIDDILGLQPSGSPADVIAARREQRRANGQVMAIDHSVDHGTKLHG
jgi:hypothetical protein